MAQAPFPTWFVDCDATAECFDDFNPLHSASRVGDMNTRRQRLDWLAKKRSLWSGAKAVRRCSLVIHFGHGVQTPYIGHLDKAFRDSQSIHFFGKHWPERKERILHLRLFPA